MMGVQAPLGLPLPAPPRPQDQAAYEAVQQVRFVLQNNWGAMMARFVTLGISQVQYGTLTYPANTATESATFTAPMPDNTYALILAPMGTFSSVAKNTTGFSATLSSPPAGNLSVDWVAIR
jgi:hypothetical protein